MSERAPARGRFVTLHDELIDRARQAVGRPDLSVASVVRLGLATLAGVDIEDYTPRPGRPKRQQQAETLFVDVDAKREAIAS